MTFQKYAFYWVRLNEINGPYWIVAQFIETKLCGKAEAVRQIQKIGASNQWEIGGILTAPQSGTE